MCLDRNTSTGTRWNQNRAVLGGQMRPVEQFADDMAPLVVWKRMKHDEAKEWLVEREHYHSLEPNSLW